MLGKTELECFYFENYKNLVKRTTSRCGSPFDAEDIVQTAFERALKYIHSCDGRLERWFDAILFNVLRAHQNAIRLGPVTKPLDEHIKEVPPVIPDDILPFIQRDIAKMMKTEAEPIRSVLRLHFDFGFTCGEIDQQIPHMTYKKVSNIINAFRLKVIKRYE